MVTTGFLGLNSTNADLGILILMTALTVGLAAMPLIPILRDIRRWVPIHALIWREHYAPSPPLQSVPTHTGQTALPEHGPRTYGLDQSQSLEEEVF